MNKKISIIGKLFFLLLFLLCLCSCSVSQVNLRGQDLGYQYQSPEEENSLNILTIQDGNKIYFKAMIPLEGDVTLIHKYNKVRETYPYSVSDDFLEILVLPIAAVYLVPAAIISSVVTGSVGKNQFREDLGPKYSRVPVVYPVVTFFGSLIFPILPGINSIVIRENSTRPTMEVLDSVYIEKVPFATKVEMLKFKDSSGLAYQVLLNGKEVPYKEYSNGWNYVELDVAEKKQKVVLKARSNGNIVATKTL